MRNGVQGLWVVLVLSCGSGFGDPLQPNPPEKIQGAYSLRIPAISNFAPSEAEAKKQLGKAKYVAYAGLGAALFKHGIEHEIEWHSEDDKFRPQKRYAPEAVDLGFSGSSVAEAEMFFKKPVYAQHETIQGEPVQYRFTKAGPEAAWRKAFEKHEQACTKREEKYKTLMKGDFVFFTCFEDFEERRNSAGVYFKSKGTVYFHLADR